jgi:hypothetical protein
MPSEILMAVVPSLEHNKRNDHKLTVPRISEKSGTNGNFIYYLNCMLYMFNPTLYSFSRPLYHVCADFAQHIGVDNSS